MHELMFQAGVKGMSERYSNVTFVCPSLQSEPIHREL